MNWLQFLAVTGLTTCAFAGVVLYKTKPTRESFSSYWQEYITDKFGKAGAPSFIKRVANKVVGTATEIMANTRIHDAILARVAIVEVDGQTFQFVGVLGTWFPLQPKK